MVTSAGQTVQDDAVSNPNQTPPLEANPATGRISAVPPTTSPTNAQLVPTTNAGDGDQGTNAPTRSFIQTQSTTDANGYNVGIALPDETGTVGTIRRNPETGELYDTGGADAPTSTGVGQYDDATGVDAAVARNAQDDTDNAYGGNSLAEYEALSAATSGLAANQNAPGNITTTGENLRIIPQPNVLDRFSSYTYRASWYLMTPDQYRQLVVSKKKQINGYMLLMQSGGAKGNSGGAQGASASEGSLRPKVPGATDADAGRNPFFPDDFYFDSITMDNLIIGNGSRAAHSVANIKFTVVEPANITLLDRLYDAVQDFMPTTGQKINYTAVVYMMVIRFYGYDENGNLVTNIGAPDKTGKSDPNAVIEKFIPFKITKCDWSIEGKLVSYNIEGAPIGMSIAAGTRRGTIPYDIQLTAKSIGELLGGDAQFAGGTAPANAPGASTTAVRATQASVRAVDNAIDATNTVYYENDGTSSTSAIPPAPPNANAATTPVKSITQGLMGAMNEFQQKLVKNGTYEFADTYKIVFASGGPGGGGQAIEKAQLIPPGDLEKKNLATAAPPTKDVNSIDPNRIAMDINSRNYAITAGMQVVQAIDLAIRNSTFIYAQQTKFFKPPDNDPNTLDEESQPGTGRDVAWYNITFQSIPKKDQYDRKRNDYAYDITFVVNTYTPMNFSSNFFPINKFRGLHKKYNYWFTGQNTAVLEYKETLNNLYNLTISGNADAGNLATRQKFSSSMRDQPYYAFQSASTESRQGKADKENEPGSNMAENLYDPAGLANCKMKIVGDPAWIQQGSFSSGVDPKNFEFNAFLPDGTINFDARQIMFEIAWQRPQDYNLNTGLADPYSGASKREPVQSRVYTASKVTSEFRQGSFTQYVEGLLYYFMKPNATNKATSAPMPNSPATQASVRAVDNALSAASPSAVDLRGRLNAAGDSRVADLKASIVGALPAPPLAAGIGGGNPGVFNAAPPGPNNTSQPTPPPQPATSGTGENLDVGDPFVPPGTLGRLSSGSVEGVQSDPQIMSRDF